MPRADDSTAPLQPPEAANAPALSSAFSRLSSPRPDQPELGTLGENRCRPRRSVLLLSGVALMAAAGAVAYSFHGDVAGFGGGGSGSSQHHPHQPPAPAPIVPPPAGFERLSTVPALGSHGCGLEQPSTWWGAAGSSSDHTIVVGGVSRSFRLRVPRSYRRGHPVPLVLVYHAYLHAPAKISMTTLAVSNIMVAPF